METDNWLLIKTISQTNINLWRERDENKNKVFITGIHVSHVIEGVKIVDKEVILQYVFKFIDKNGDNDKYTIVQIIEPTQGRTRHSAEVTTRRLPEKI